MSHKRVFNRRLTPQIKTIAAETGVRMDRRQNSADGSKMKVGRETTITCLAKAGTANQVSHCEFRRQHSLHHEMNLFYKNSPLLGSNSGLFVKSF